jgi:hypothetical protein
VSFEESFLKYLMICFSKFPAGLTTILKHGKKKRNTVLLKLKAGVAQR